MKKVLFLFQYLQNMNNTTLNPHAQVLLEQYHHLLPIYEKMAEVIPEKLKEFFCEAGIIVAAVEHRVKTESSLAGKLQLKGDKYQSIHDITDLVGIRVITFYNDDVDKVASVLERLFEIDWENSIDKRKAHEIDSFGYLSLHYICSIPESAYSDPDHPELNKIRFEVQMRTVLQHAWANMNHDTGYKSGVEIPKVYKRNLSRLAGMLELVDDEFSRIRQELADYRRQVQNLVASGNLSEVQLDGDAFKSYLQIGPFDVLMRRIASINQAEIQPVDLSAFLSLFKAMNFKTLGDIDSLIKNYSDAAYQIACFQIGLTDIDILSSSVAPQNLCTAYILKKGGGQIGLKWMLDTLNGPSEVNEAMAGLLLEQTKDLPFMNQ
jgi:ppGpp synthetase/RelA/SpoT-type nucleotidyltranferase